MQATFFRLVQRNLHDLLGDALDIDIHLQRRDTCSVPPP